MKTVRIPAEVEARIVHECPRLTRLLSSDDGRLEVEKFVWALNPDSNAIYARGYRAGRKAQAGEFEPDETEP